VGCGHVVSHIVCSPCRPERCVGRGEFLCVRRVERVMQAITPCAPYRCGSCTNSVCEVGSPTHVGSPVFGCSVCVQLPRALHVWRHTRACSCSVEQQMLLNCRQNAPRQLGLAAASRVSCVVLIAYVGVKRGYPDPLNTAWCVPYSGQTLVGSRM